MPAGAAQFYSRNICALLLGHGQGRRRSISTGRDEVHGGHASSRAIDGAGALAEAVRKALGLEPVEQAGAVPTGPRRDRRSDTGGECSNASARSC